MTHNHTKREKSNLKKYYIYNFISSNEILSSVDRCKFLTNHIVLWKKTYCRNSEYQNLIRKNNSVCLNFLFFKSLFLIHGYLSKTIMKTIVILFLHKNQLHIQTHTHKHTHTHTHTHTASGKVSSEYFAAVAFSKWTI